MPTCLTYLPLLVLVLIALWCASPHASAATVLFDFETDAELRLWHYENRDTSVPVREASLGEGWATSGKRSLVFSSPQWKPGMAEWPAFECKPPITDWSAFDRLVFDVTNPSPSSQTVNIFISDSKHPTRAGLLVRVALEPFSRAQTLVPIADLAQKGLDPADIHVMHVFTTRPPGDMALHLDRFVLLKAGEELPVPSPEYVRAFITLRGADVEALRKALADGGERIRGTVAASPALRTWADRELATLTGQLNAYADRVARADATLLTESQTRPALLAALDRLEKMADLRTQFEAVRPKVRVGDAAREDIVVGFATSMEKILPRAGVPPITIAPATEISLARYEKESFQVVVIPWEQDAKQVQVQVGDLTSADGKIFAAANIQAPVVGYVETKSVPPYGSSHVGWWPDPILNFQHTADIARGDAQAFWVRVHAPQNQPAGVYNGKLTVLVDDKPAFAFDLSVRVYGFAVPVRTPLPLAVTFSPHDHPTEATRAQQAEWRKSPDYPIKAWRRHRLEWGDFLADYYLNYDSLYHHEQPDFEVLDRLNQQGRLGMFNLGYYGACGESEQEIANWKASTLDRIRKGYDEAKARGLLNHAYIYGCDENPHDMFPGVERAAAILKQEFPGVLIMTTTYDNTYGLGSVIKSMDAFCPLTPSFNPEQVEAARETGRQVWWYTCCGPHHPFLNTFIEYPAIEGRLLMGAMTAKYRPDGYLYYQISIWNSQKPIESGSFTDWDPRSWTVYHGDGSWTCVGPDGTPLPTVRLENFRDGLEDWAYVWTLDATIAKVEASAELRATRQDWLARAKEIVQVPASVLASKTEYTHDPAAVYAWRNAVAQAIEDAGTEPAYPW